MPREAKLNKPSNLTPFAALLWDALEHYHDPAQLGQNSPLAQVYFLGQDLLEISMDDMSPQRRGEVLVKLMQRAYQTLIQRKVDVRLLQACFLAPQIYWVEDEAGNAKTKTIGIRKRLIEVKINHASFYAKLAKTELPKQVEQLATVILQQRRMALRLEQPIIPPPLYERTKVEQRCRDLLVNENAAIGLTGESGVGKTALGQYLAHTYFAGRIFWFTFRPYLNDRLLELLFNLGHFCQLYLQQVNAGQNSALLATLIGLMQANQGETLPQEILLNTWRADLALMPRPPLLCFDEVDILHYETPQHEPLLQFLQSLLTDPLPLILIGQELPIIVPQSYSLQALTAQDGLVKLLKYHGLTLTPTEQELLHSTTNGNPRWLQLWVAFYQVGNKLTDFTTHLPYHTLFERISQRLTEDKLALLYELAVFHQAAPVQAWANQAALLSQLEQLHLIEFDLHGGVQIRAHWRDYFIKQLKQTETWQLYNEKAAKVYTTHGQFTTALFHYTEAKNYSAAIACWQEHRQKEIEQGQADHALTLLQTIPEQSLIKADRLTLTELLVDLLKVRGRYSQALSILARVVHRGKNLTEAHLRRLEGDILQLRGENERARQAYQAGLETVEQLLTEKALFHKNLA